MATLPTDYHTPEGEPSEEELARMTFTQHLAELRSRLIWAGGAVILAMIICYIFSNQIIDAIKWPLSGLSHYVPGAKPIVDAPDGSSTSPQWTILNPLEPVLVKLKVAAYCGIILALPFILYQLGAFIFPGLTAKERRAVTFLIYGCTVLALAGLAISYFLVFPLVLPYLAQFVPEGVVIQFRLNETILLLMKGFAGFALAFQFPMVVLVLVYMGILEPAVLKKYRKIAVVACFFIGMLLTPPDPFSMLIMAIPLIILYEISIWLSYIVVRRRDAEAT